MIKNKLKIINNKITINKKIKQINNLKDKDNIKNILNRKYK